jgi:membrane protein DedA with SNARE-associated domain
MVDFLSSFPAYLIYMLLFFLLFLCGVGFPMAEELVLLGGGVLVASAVLRPVPMLLSTFSGTIIGDVLLFWLGRSLGTRLTRSVYLTRWLPLHQIVKGRAFFARYGNTTVFFARFIPGLRAPTFLLAGTMHMPFWRFTTMDILAGLIFVPMICWLGYLFADHFEVLTYWFRNVQRTTVTVLVLLGLSWWLWRHRGKRGGHDATMHASGTDQS